VSERFCVTGSHGCLGAWTVAELVREGADVVALDIGPGPGRAALLLQRDELADIRFEQGDVTDLDTLRRVFSGVTHVIHLAALQYPDCRADHLRGAHVNVLGTVAVFDAALAAGAKLVYTSSLAALLDGQLYGAWKLANEKTASAFWAEDGFPSIGLRPALVYGLGRDRGVTAAVTLAMRAAAHGLPFHIPFGGSTPLNHAGDVAKLLVRCARAVSRGALVYDAGGPVHTIAEIVDEIEQAAPGAAITFGDEPFAPTPPSYDGSALEEDFGPVEWRPLETGVRETVEAFRVLESSAQTGSSAHGGKGGC
jgi:nucleoside-diphosphate-sugar epimerase